MIVNRPAWQRASLRGDGRGPVRHRPKPKMEAPIRRVRDTWCARNLPNTHWLSPRSTASGAGHLADRECKRVPGGERRPERLLPIPRQRFILTVRATINRSTSVTSRKAGDVARAGEPPNWRIPLSPSRWAGHAHTSHHRSRSSEPASGGGRRLVAVRRLALVRVNHPPAVAGTTPNALAEGSQGWAW